MGRVVEMVRLSPEEDEKRLKLYREGLNDHEIGKILGLSNFTILKWRRKHNLEPQTIEKFCKSEFEFKGSEEDLIYLAGFFDGEGCVSITKSKNRKTGFIYAPRISIVNTNKSIMVWINSLINGGVQKRYSKGNNKTKLEWQLTRLKDILKFTQLFKPYVKVKKRQLEVMEKFIKIRLSKPFGHHSYSIQEEQLYLELKELNKRGKRNVK